MIAMGNKPQKHAPTHAHSQTWIIVIARTLIMETTTPSATHLMAT